MKDLLRGIVLLAVLVAFFSCEPKKSKPVPLQAGVVLSFDDAYVDEWFAADRLLKKYHWKATFCVCRIDSIGKPQLKKLHTLQAEGHEIAGHGYHHYNAVSFVDTHGIAAYKPQEIDPMMAAMKRLQFGVTSFAYPYGERSSALDTVLSPTFKIIRGRAFCGNAPEKEGCYFTHSKFVYAFDIDNSHVHFSIPYLVELLKDAKKKNKVLILCSHRPVANITANYQTKFKTLAFVCSYIKMHHMKFYTLSDLDTHCR